MKVNEMKILLSIAILLLVPTAIFAQQAIDIQVSEKDLARGDVTHRVALKYYQKPVVTIENAEYSPIEDVPEEIVPSSTLNVDIKLGKERKLPFAVIHVPLYSLNDATATAQKLTSFTLNISELKQSEINNTRALAKTTADNSPLASGKWFKISVSETGMYKVDHNFIATNFGVTGLRTSQIRMFGNGGKMLPEENGVDEIKGLTETGIWVSDGGDGSFDAGDYFVFYGQGPVNNILSKDGNWLEPEKNYYTDKGYYFLNFEGSNGMRVENQTNPPVANVQVNTYTGVAVHENDLANPQQFGKLWWGEEFSNAPGKQTSHTVQLNLGNVTDSTEFRVNVVNTSKSPGSFNIVLNGQPFDNVELGAADNGAYAPKALGKESILKIPYSSSNANFTITYSTSSNDGSGWLDYIKSNSRKQLSLSGDFTQFADIKSIGAGNIAAYNLANANGSTQVWDITDAQQPVRMSGSLNGNTYSFSRSAEVLHQFVAFNPGGALPAPAAEGEVSNQNLSGSGQVDYIIVTHPDFKQAAEKLADFHRGRSNMRVLVATTQQIYNEFSSGAQDIGAIRDFARMFYQRAGMNVNEMPKYLLLMGDASYDYKDRVSSNTNYVPVFEARESSFFLNSFSTDDYYGFLDDGEDIERYDILNTLDIGVGRMPVKSLQEANTAVNKVIHYKSPATLGEWRLSTMFIADDEDNAGEHLGDAELMNDVVQDNSGIHNATKVYQDAIPTISTPSGARAPEANKMINDQVLKGVFLINYSGHGNTTVLSHERIVTKDDYNKWRNLDKMPFMITATCDFGQFDQPSFVSAGEELMLKGNGGAIATLTTTHLVYAFANKLLNEAFLEAQFSHVNGKWNTFGDAMRIGKNIAYADGSFDSGVIQNFRKFTLLGDPALEPNFPEYFIKTTAIKDGATGLPTDTISALGEYFVEGAVTDVDGNVLTDFNGELAVTFFDKARVVKTITQANKTFRVRNNVLHKGKATVENGIFSFAFIAPKDINYEYGKGRVSMYADNGVTDAAGRDSSVTVGGFSDNPRIENNPPVVRAFIKDSLFIDGGLTGSNTALFAILEDETGINVSGNAVGHDLVAILDGDVSNPYIMNDYYETAPNTYKRGFVYFPIENIPDGIHRLTVKAWDVNNNSGEGSVNFLVKDGEVFEVQKLMNYPNPFANLTHFVFEHNHPDEDLRAEINIYTTSGVFVRKLVKDFISTGSKSHEITWDGSDNNGGKLPSGVYIYKMKLSTQENIQTTAYQKLVIVR